MAYPALAFLLTLCLAACDGGGNPAREPRQAQQDSAWEIGPVIDGKNYSLGLPLRPTTFADGWGFAISPTAEPHYITKRATLAGKTVMRMRYRVEGDGTIYGKGCALSSPSAVTLYFQKANDDWRTDGNRWWATFASVPLSRAGEYSIEAPLDGAWTSVYKLTADAPEFAVAKRNADRVGFTFANCEGYGHGARATAPMQFIVTSFEVR